MWKQRPTRSTGGQSKARFCGRAMPEWAHEPLHLTGLHGTAMMPISTSAIDAATTSTGFNKVNVIMRDESQPDKCVSCWQALCPKQFRRKLRVSVSQLPKSVSCAPRDSQRDLEEQAQHNPTHCPRSLRQHQGWLQRSNTAVGMGQSLFVSSK